MKAEKQYWLMKSEPDSYSIDHLEKDGTTPWTGVRNYQSRNFMRAMNIGDEVLFYHSSCPQPGIYGLAKVTATAHPDETQFDKKSPYYDARATKTKPLWDLVDVSFVMKFKTPVLLSEMRSDSKLASMVMLHRGSRLSVTPVTKEEFDILLSLHNKDSRS